ncbi:transporter substrate-binding domain-containing protein [Teredinibacter turnerae]|uniref:transporter substrate-binding domain-containing protein n=2 Tax=Teredinibacter turnerae TaxID=2426 RepID=UPI0003655E2F|nr:transporter substrate-binding domain-containing protein [Teredinibacter turnerae]
MYIKGLVQASITRTAGVMLMLALSLPGNSATTLAQFWATPISPARASYETALVQAILEATKSQYGPYKLEVKYLTVSFDRGRRAVALSDGVNFFANPLQFSHLETDINLQLIAEPLMEGLLGYRRLIVRKEDLQMFTELSDFSTFAKLRPGQATDWADNAIYQENHLPLVEAISLENLFNMLERKRFDYLPLSIGEAPHLMKGLVETEEKFAIVPNLVLFYPFPVMFQVSKQHPELVTRLTQGLEQVKASGEYQTLLKTHFAKELEFLAKGEYKLIHLSNKSVKQFDLNEPRLAKPTTFYRSPQL